MSEKRRPIRDVDVVVVGGGPAGLSAAMTAAQAGASVLMLEASREFGGLLGLQSQPLRDRLDLYEGMTGRAYVTTLQGRATAAGAQLVARAPVFDVDGGRDLTISFTCAGVAERVTARRIIVATGSTDGVTTFPGWTLPGILLTQTAQTMVSRWRERPGSRALVVGAGDEALIVAMNLRDAGVEVVAVVSVEPELTAMPDMLRDARASRIRLMPGYVVLDATGSDEVENVTIESVDRRNESSAEVLAVDCVVLATGRASEFRVASLLGVKTAYEHDLGGWVPAVDELFRTSDRRVLMAGDASGIENGAVAIAQGRLAGLRAAEALGMRHADAAALAVEATGMIAERRVGRRGEARAAARQRIALDQGDRGGRRDPANATYEVPEGGIDSVVACMCTGATLGDVRAAVAPGNGAASEVRRLSGAGMGICQGRYCDALVGRVIAEQTGRPIAEAGLPRVRAPVYPVTLAALAKLDDSGQDAVLE